jgi:Tfp pilus assembly protein PilO
MKLPRISVSSCWPVYAAGAGVCAAVSLILWLAVLSSAFQQREVRHARAAELTSRRQKAGEVAGALAALRRKSEAVEKSLRKTAIRLEPAALVNDRLAKLTDLANECGLNVDEVQPGRTTDGPHYQTVALKLAGSGSYPACAKFLHKLHDAFPDTGIRTMETSNTSPNPLSPQVAFRVDLLWYAAPLSQTADPAPVAKTE